MLDRQSGSVLLAMSLLLAPSSAALAQSAPAELRPVTQVSVRNGSTFSPQHTASAPQLIQGDNLSAAQLSQIFSSGPKVFSIDTASSISGNVLIPRGITLINLITSSSAGLNIDGNLVSSGKLIFSSSDSSLSLATLNANNVTVSPGGLISSINNLSLSINALSNIVNAGTISSAGNLNLTAGGSITNVSSYATQPVMQAMQNINLTSAMGSFTNSGLINAIGGNVNVAATTASQSIDFNNLLGTVQANNAINFRDASYTGSGNIDIRGGNWISQALNFNSGKGTIDAFVNDITGVVNATACNAHIGTFDSATLNLGNLNVSGDPTYFNTGGDLLVSGDVSTGGFDLAFLASGNVLLTGSSISTDSTGDGGNLLVVAGADLSPANILNNTGDTSTVITINKGSGSGGGSTTGGNVNIAGKISSTSSSGGDGGNVQIIAYSGNTNAGTITIGDSISTGGNGSLGANGNVTIISGASASVVDAISIKGIDTTGSTQQNPGGIIVLNVASPAISSPPITVLDGVQTGGSFIADTFQTGSITTNGALLTKSAGVQLASGGDITIGGNITTNGVGFTAGAIAILSGGNMTTKAGGAPFAFEASSNSGSGASLSLVAGAALQAGTSANQAIVTGASSSGGSIDFSTGAGKAGVTFLSTTNLASASGKTGAVRAIAFAGGTPGSGTVDWNAGASTIISGGTGVTSGGVTVTAGATSGTSINMGDIDTRKVSSSSTSGAITINTASPAVPGNVTFTSGSLSSGSFSEGSTQSASAVVSNLKSPGGKVTVIAGKDLTLNGSIEIKHVNGAPSVTLLVPNGTLTAQGGSSGQILMLETVFATDDGGTVNITAKDIVVNGAGAFEIHAEGKGGSGAGGSVSITQLSSNSLNIGTASGGNNIFVSAAGTGLGSYVNLSSGGNLVVDTAGLSYGGSGSQLALTAGTAGAGDLRINNSLSGTGSGVILTLISESSSAFTIGGSSGNFIQGTLSATAPSGNGGTVTVKNLGTGGINLPNSSDIIVSSGFNAAGSHITLETPGPITLGPGTLSVKAKGFAGGGELAIRAGADLTIPSSGLTLDAGNDDSFNNYGSIVITHGGSGVVAFGSGDNIVANGLSLIAGNGGYTTTGTNNIYGANVAIVQKNSIDASTIAGVVNENSFRLTLVSTGGDVGTSASPLVITRNDFTVQSTTKGVFINNNLFGEGNINLVDTTVEGKPYTNSAASTFSVIASGLLGSETIGTANGVNIVADKVELSSSAGFALAGNVTGSSSIGLVSNNTISNTSVASLKAPAVGLVALGAGADVGTSTSARVLVNADVFTGHSKFGSVFVNNISTGDGKTGDVVLGDITINGVNYKNSAKASYSFMASAVTNDLTSTGDVSGTDVVLASANNIDMGSTITASNQLAFLAQQYVTSLGNSSAAQMTVASTAADIGTPSSRLSVNAPTFTVSAGGSAYVTNVSTGDLNGDVNLDKSSVEGQGYSNFAGSTFSVQANNVSSGKSFKVSDSIFAKDIALKSSGGFTMAAAANGSGSVAIVSNDSIVNSSISAIAPQLTLAVTGASANIGVSSSDRVSVDASTLTLSSKSGSVFVTNSSSGDVDGNVNLQDSIVDGVTYKNSAALTYSLQNQGIVAGDNTVTQVGTDVSATDVDLTSSGGFDLKGNTTGTNSAALISFDSITSAGALSAPSVTLVALGPGATVGDVNNRVTVSASNLTAQAESVFITDTSTGDKNGNVNLVDSIVNGTPYVNGANQTYSVKASGLASGKSLVTSTNISAPNVVLNSSGTIQVGAGGLNGSTNIALISNDSITNANIGGPLTTPTLVLAATATGSSIGTSALSPLVLDDMEFVTASANGSVFIRDDRKLGDITLINTSVDGVIYGNTAGNTYSFKAPNLGVLNTELKSTAATDVIADEIVLVSGGKLAMAGGLLGAGPNDSKSVSLIAQRSITTLGQVFTDHFTIVVTGASQNIGSNEFSPLTVTASKITARAEFGSVFLADGILDSDVDLMDSTVDGVSYTNKASNFYSIYAPVLGAGNNITIPTGVTVESNSVVQLVSGQGSGGGIQNNGSIIAASEVHFMSSDSILSIGSVSTPKLMLIANGAGASIGSDAGTGRVLVDVGRLVLNAPNGSAFVTDSYTGGAVQIETGFILGSPVNNSVDSANGTYDLATTKSISPGFSFIQGKAVSLSSTTGDISAGDSNFFAVDITLNCPSGTLTVKGNDLSPNTLPERGGSVTIVANKIIGDQAGQPININVSGIGFGNGAGGKIDISGPSGLTIGTGEFNLILKANAGTNPANPFGDAGSISVSAGQVDVDLASVEVNPGGVGGKGGTLSLSAVGGPLTFLTSSSVNVDGLTNGDGGQITLLGTTAINFNSGQPLTLSANGAGSGNGGKITVTSLFGGTPLTVNTGNGNLNFSAKGGAAGGNGGFVSVTSGGDIDFSTAGVTADPNAAGNGNGAHVTMIAAGTLNLIDSLYSYNGAGNGSGGLIHFEGDSISAVGRTLSASSNAIGAGNGGTIEYVVNSSSSGNVILDQTTGVKLLATGGSLLSPSGDGGTITVLTNGTISIDASGVDASPLGSSGNGAKLSFSGSTVSKIGGSALILNASGVGLGDGGSITINQNTTSPQSIGTAATNSFKLTADAGAGGGSGGTVSVSSGGNLTVDPAGVSILAVSPSGQLANGGTLEFKTSSGNLLVTGPLSANAAGSNILSVGGNITLESNSKTAFIIKTGSTNGTKGDLSVKGNAAGNGSISITNNGGGITDGQAAITASSISFTTGNNGAIAVNGTLTGNTVLLSANGTGNITAAKTIQSGTVNAQTGTGNISLTNLNLTNATNVSANTAGNVAVTGTIVSPLVPGLLTVTGAGGKAITIKTPGGILVTGAVAGTSAVTLQSTSKNAGTLLASTGAISSNGTVKLEAPGISLSNNVTSVGNMTITSKLSNISIGTGVQLNAGVLVSVGPDAAPLSPLPLISKNVTKAGSITLSSAGTSTSAIDTGNNAVIQSNGAGVTIKTTNATGGIKIADSSVTANGGAISISSKGQVSIGSLLGNGATLLARSLNNGSGTITVAGAGISIGTKSSISANKAVTLTANGTGATGLQIENNVSIIANAGVLKITSKGDMAIKSSSNLSGSSVTMTGAGDLLDIKDGVTIAATAAKSGNISLSMTRATTGSLPVLSVGDGFNFTTVGGNLTITGKAGGVVLGKSGGLVGGKISAGGSTSTVLITSSGTTFVGASAIDAGKSVTITAPKSTLEVDGTVIGGTQISSTISLSGQTGLTIKGNSDLKSLNNLTATAVATTANLNLEDGVQLSAGKLTGAAPVAAFSPTQVQSKGSIVLTGGKEVNFGDNNVLTSNGGDIKVIAKTGDMEVGSTGTAGNKLNAYGGNIQMLAKGTVNGANNNSFTAFGVGATSPLSNTGGGIEIGSGLISSTALNTAFGSKTVPTPAGNALPAGITGSPLPVAVNTNGVIAVNNKSGNANPINLSGSTLNFLPAFKGGVQVFDAATTGASVTMPGATFTTSAFKPISMTTVDLAVQDNSFDREVSLKDSGAQVFSTAETRLVQSSAGALHLEAGEIFISASSPVSIGTEHAQVLASKGALLAIKQFQGNTYVRACSEAGTVSLKIDNRKINLNPGEEIAISSHKLDRSEIYLADGLGRRHSKTSIIGQKHVCITDFAIITLLSSSDTISFMRHSGSSSSKHLINRMLKTAATIDTVLKHRGAYSAN